MNRIIKRTNMEHMSMVAPIGGSGIERAMRDTYMAVARAMYVEGRELTSITNGMPNCGGGDVSTDVAGASTGVTDGPDVAASDDDDGGDSDGEPARRSPLKPPSPSGKHRNVTATAGALSFPPNPDIALWRLPTVLAHVPVSKSEWWRGIKTGRYPAGIKLSPRVTAWRSSDIRSLIASL